MSEDKRGNDHPATSKMRFNFAQALRDLGDHDSAAEHYKLLLRYLTKVPKTPLNLIV